MSLLNHIFNLKRIADNVKADVPSKHEKVYSLFKGATVGTPEMITEIEVQIKKQSAFALKYLAAKKKELKKLQEAQS